MRLTIEYDQSTRTQTFTLKITNQDRVQARAFDGFDLALFEDIEGDPKATVSDYLLRLERVARAVEAGQ